MLFKIIVSALGCLLFASCNVKEETCPAIWDLDLRELTATALIDSGQCRLTIYNPSESIGIILTQTNLVGDFQLDMKITDYTWDTLMVPQFRIQVFDPNAEQIQYSGIAISPRVAYAYVGFDEGNPSDLRIVSEHTGTVHIGRVGDAISISYLFGNVALSVTDTLTDTDLQLELVFGTVEDGVGKMSIALDDFEISDQPQVLSDAFECAAW